MSSLDLLKQYLLNGDLLGFITACYTSSMGQYFYALLAMLFTSPLYIRTGSLLLLCIVWILIGGIMITAMPLLSNIAVLFMVLGIGGTLWDLYQQVKR